MKKTFTVNLGGSVFHIDEDAYQLLHNYLNNLKLYFRKQEGADEITDDIEARVSELFAEKLKSGSQVITLSTVEEVILQVGKPEEFDNDSSSESSHSNQQSTFRQDQQYGKRKNQRLFRNPDNKIFGGVASGIAAYLDWDPMVIRALFVLLLFSSFGFITFLYILAWIFIPLAHTAADKLNMRGEPVTVENIGKTVTDGFEEVTQGVNNFIKSKQARSTAQKIGDFLVQVTGIVLKVMLIIFAIAFSPFLFVLAIAFVILLIVFISALVSGGNFMFQMFPNINWSPLNTISPLLTVGGSMAGIALIGIPIFGVLYTAMQRGFGWTPLSKTIKWTLLFLWIVALGVLIANLSSLSWQLPLYGIHTI